MQSYLQYRRLGNAVRKQLESHGSENGGSPVEAGLGADEKDFEASATDGSGELNSPAPRTNASPLAQSRSHRSEKTARAYGLGGIDVQMLPNAEGVHSQFFIVGWDGENDPQNPRNYPFRTRVTATLLVAALGWVVTASSSISSAVEPQAASDYGVSEVVGSLLTGEL